MPESAAPHKVDCVCCSNGGVIAIEETPIKLITFMVRQGHHERNRLLNVRPELFEGLVRCFLESNAHTGWHMQPDQITEAGICTN